MGSEFGLEWLPLAPSGESKMTKLKLLSTATLLAILAVAPSLAQARSHHHSRYHHYRHWLPYEISYLHNYGPGVVPGTFAYYDGPSTNHCLQSSANYVAQDRRLHPCF
jgi:hypothetical protein